MISQHTNILIYIRNVIILTPSNKDKIVDDLIIRRNHNIVDLGNIKIEIKSMPPLQPSSVGFQHHIVRSIVKIL